MSKFTIQLRPGAVSFNFEVVPFSGESFSIREVGKPYIAIFHDGYEAGLELVEILGAVYLKLSHAERRRYRSSVVFFMDYALKHPDAVRELLAGVSGSQLGLWSETQLPTSDVKH